MFLHKLNPLIKSMGHMLTRHLCIVHSFFGFDKPICLPPNVKMIGLGISEDEPQTIPEDIRNWLNMIKSRKLKIIYVTFGSMIVATQ